MGHRVAEGKVVVVLSMVKVRVRDAVGVVLGFDRFSFSSIFLS